MEILLRLIFFSVACAVLDLLVGPIPTYLEDNKDTARENGKIMDQKYMRPRMRETTVGRTKKMKANSSS